MNKAQHLARVDEYVKRMGEYFEQVSKLLSKSAKCSVVVVQNESITLEVRPFNRKAADFDLYVSGDNLFLTLDYANGPFEIEMSGKGNFSLEKPGLDSMIETIIKGNVIVYFNPKRIEGEIITFVVFEYINGRWETLIAHGVIFSKRFTKLKSTKVIRYEAY